METKFLQDGRKVVIVGQLNTTESIVQEIFVTATGDEIPGGERFVSSALFDVPVVTYKEKQVLEWADSVAKHKVTVEALRAEAKVVKQELLAQRELLVQSKKIEASFGVEHVERIANFMTGQIEYLVVEEYDITPPIKMMDRIVYWETNYGERTFDSIKLCSILGRSDGDLGYRIHQYSDTSGSYVNVYPCLTLDEALARITSRAEALIDEGWISDASIQACVDMGIVVSPAHTAKNAEQKSARAERQRAQLEAQLADINAKLEGLNGDQIKIIWDSHQSISSAIRNLL